MFANIANNIKATIGVEFEIIKIDNRENKYSICQAYNKGAEKAKYNFICFVHEDVMFVSQNWGITFTQHFSVNNSLGVVGLGGSYYKGPFASGWGALEKKLDFVNIQMQALDGNFEIFYNNPGGGALTETVILDGVLLFTQKKVWQLVKFNEQIKGFHFYDIDFCLRLFLSGYKAAVENTVTVKHFSRGKFDDRWVVAALQYHKKNKKLIKEVIKKSGTIPQRSIEELQTLWLKRFSKHNISKINKINLLLAYRPYFSKSYIKTCYRFLRYNSK